jgi:hypothetical protein
MTSKPRDATRGGVNGPALPVHPVGLALPVQRGERPLSITDAMQTVFKQLALPPKKQYGY